MNKPTIRQREILREYVNYTCSICHKTEFELSLKYKKVTHLEIHRIKQGGEYSLNNINVICNDCHKMISYAQNKASGIIA